MKHEVTISVNRAKATNVLECRRVSLKDRVLRALLGKNKKVLLLIPSDSVQTVTIKEVESEADSV